MRLNVNVCALLACFSVVCCATSWADDETTSSVLHDADGNQIGFVDWDGRLISQSFNKSDQLLFESALDTFSLPNFQATFAATMSPTEASSETIDKVNFATNHAWCFAGTGMTIGGDVTTYDLSDGSSWSSGAGSASYGRMRFDRMEVDGSVARFYFTDSELFFRKTDYNNGSHAANFRLNVAGPLVIVADLDSRHGVLEGQALIAVDEPANYADSRFNYLSAVRGSVVTFRVEYTLDGSHTFSEGLFDDTFSYAYTGAVNLTDVISSPVVNDVAIIGSSIAPEDAIVSFASLATYENDAQHVVTNDSQWTCSNPEIASFGSPGKLTINPVDQDTEITLSVSYTNNGTQFTDSKTITIINKEPVTSGSSWPMYQANARHDGYSPVTLDVNEFRQLWQTTIDSNVRLNRITAAAGKVFTSGTGQRIDVIDAQTGVVLWSDLLAGYSHGSFPSYANGVVYLQTGNHDNDTWLRAYDAESGEQIFMAPHAAQWDDYYAPTIYEDTVFVNAGYYGGAYAFDAFSGHLDWSIGLPQYENWTPAVDERYVYAYTGGLYVIDRLTGELACTIVDPNFDWNGYSMNLAPVIGGQLNILVIQDGRLVNFDIENRRIAYEINEAFTGQVCVAKGNVYAINAGNIDIRDEATGDLLDTIDLPEEFLDTMIITDSHIIARAQHRTFAISLDTKEVDWLFTRGGYMALSDGRLYIADGYGRVTAINAPSVVVSTPPIADAGEDQVAGAGPECMAIVTLDGSGSSDADGDELTYAWYYDGELFGEGVRIEAELGTGEYVFTLIVNDGTFDSEPDDVLVTVEDNTEPVVVVGEAIQIWPPNHKFYEFTLSDLVVNTEDNCSGVLDIDAVGKIVSIECNESDTTNGDAVIMGDSAFKVRAERDGHGDGRVYTITFEVVDEAGNVSIGTGYVIVPHDKSDCGGRHGNLHPRRKAEIRKLTKQTTRQNRIRPTK